MTKLNKIFMSFRLRLVSVCACCLFAGVAAVADSHPRLLLTRDELPALREKIKSGVPAATYQALLKRCDKHLALQDLPKSHEIDTRCDPLTELAIAALLSGDKRYSDKFGKLVLLARTKKIDIDKLKYNIALIFDTGYDMMSKADREYIKSILVQKADAYRKRSAPYWMFNSNWATIVHMKGLLEALALKGEMEYDPVLAQRGIDELRTLFSQWIDDSGMASEHGAYLDYCLIINGGLLCYFYNRTGVDLVTGTNLKKLPVWIMLASSPLTPMRWNAMGDSNLQDPSPYSMRLLLCLLPDDALMNEAVSRCRDQGAPDPISGIFFYRQPQHHETVDCPPAEYFEASNLVAYKSDFTPNAFSVVSEARWRHGHVHSDVGSFVLWRDGIQWVMDSGYDKSDAGAHNLVLIDGKGPVKQGCSGIVRQCLVAPSAIVFSSSAKDAWNASRLGNLRTISASPVAFADRSLVIIPEDDVMKVPSYVLVSDFVKKDNARHDYSWIMQLDAKSVFSSTKNGHCVVTNSSNDNAKMDVFFLQPEELEITDSEVVDYGRFKGRSHHRLNATFTRAIFGRFLVMLYPRHNNMPEVAVKRINRNGFNWELRWPDAIDLIAASEEGQNAVNYELALLRMPSNANGKISRYLMVNGRLLSFGGKELVKLSYEERAYVIRASVAYSGKELYIDTYCDPEFSVQQLAAPVKVRAWAPNAEKVIYNGQQVDLSRDGEYVEISGKSRICRDNDAIQAIQHQHFIDTKIEKGE